MYFIFLVKYLLDKTEKFLLNKNTCVEIYENWMLRYSIYDKYILLEIVN